MAQISAGVSAYAARHKKSSTDKKKLGLSLGQLCFASRTKLT